MITKFRRAFWETCVKYKGSDPIVLRDYDIIKMREKGMELQEIGNKYGITAMAVHKILKKYK